MGEPVYPIWPASQMGRALGPCEGADVGLDGLAVGRQALEALGAGGEVGDAARQGRGDAGDARHVLRELGRVGGGEHDGRALQARVRQGGDGHGGVRIDQLAGLVEGRDDGPLGLRLIDRHAPEGLPHGRQGGRWKVEGAGLGEGGEQNAPLGRAVIGGLMLATVATLVIVPLLFSMVHGRQRSGTSTSFSSGVSHV